MPFGNVTNNSGNLPKLDGSYTLEIERIEDIEPGQYGDRMRWVFTAVDEDGEQVCYDSGDPYEWYQTTGATLGPRSTAREWAQKFLGRELREGETGAEIAEQLVGKKARALVELQDNGYSRISGLTAMKRKAPAKQEDDADPF
jgi:hypothetical protein